MNVRYRPVIVITTFLLVAASCATANPPPARTTTSSTATRASAPITVRTTPPVTSSSSAAPATSGVPADEVSLRVVGSDTVLSIDGNVTIEGLVSEPASVTVGGVSADTYGDSGGTTGFFAELSLDTGHHEVPVVATTEAGALVSTVVTVVVDPDMTRELAYITEIDVAAGTIVADYVQWLTGDEARAAAIEDGEIADDQELDDGYYIRNQNPRLRTLAVAPDTPIVLYVCYPDTGPCLTRESVTLTVFEQLTADPASSINMEGWSWYGSGYLPYWLTIADSRVVQIEEQYLP